MVLYLTEKEGKRIVAIIRHAHRFQSSLLSQAPSIPNSNIIIGKNVLQSSIKFEDCLLNKNAKIPRVLEISILSPKPKLLAERDVCAAIFLINCINESKPSKNTNGKTKTIKPIAIQSTVLNSFLVSLFLLSSKINKPNKTG